MKRQFFLLLSLFIAMAAVSIANQKSTKHDLHIVHDQSRRAEQPVEMKLLFGLEMLQHTDMKKLKMEEDGRHLVFHFERVRKMKKGCRFCCSLCKLFLGLIHISLLLMMFTHIFH